MAGREARRQRRDGRAGLAPITVSVASLQVWWPRPGVLRAVSCIRPSRLVAHLRPRWQPAPPRAPWHLPPPLRQRPRSLQGERGGERGALRAQSRSELCLTGNTFLRMQRCCPEAPPSPQQAQHLRRRQRHWPPEPPRQPRLVRPAPHQWPPRRQLPHPPPPRQQRLRGRCGSSSTGGRGTRARQLAAGLVGSACLPSTHPTRPLWLRPRPRRPLWRPSRPPRPAAGMGQRAL